MHACKHLSGKKTSILWASFGVDRLHRHGDSLRQLLYLLPDAQAAADVDEKLVETFHEFDAVLATDAHGEVGRSQFVEGVDKALEIRRCGVSTQKFVHQLTIVLL